MLYQTKIASMAFLLFFLLLFIATLHSSDLTDQGICFARSVSPVSRTPLSPALQKELGDEYLSFAKNSPRLTELFEIHCHTDTLKQTAMERRKKISQRHCLPPLRPPTYTFTKQELRSFFSSKYKLWKIIADEYVIKAIADKPVTQQQLSIEMDSAIDKYRRANIISLRIHLLLLSKKNDLMVELMQKF